MSPNFQPQPVTLADLKEDGRLVWVCCLDCCLQREVKPDIISLTLWTPVPDIQRRLNCKACGGQLSIKPQPYEKPVAEM